MSRLIDYHMNHMFMCYAWLWSSATFSKYEIQTHKRQKDYLPAKPRDWGRRGEVGRQNPLHIGPTNVTRGPNLSIFLGVKYFLDLEQA